MGNFWAEFCRMNRSFSQEWKRRPGRGKSICKGLGFLKDISGSWNCGMLDKGSTEGENRSKPAHGFALF